MLVPLAIHLYLAQMSMHGALLYQKDQSSFVAFAVGAKNETAHGSVFERRTLVFPGILGMAMAVDVKRGIVSQDDWSTTVRRPPAFDRLRELRFRCSMQWMTLVQTCSAFAFANRGERARVARCGYWVAVQQLNWNDVYVHRHLLLLEPTRTESLVD